MNALALATRGYLCECDTPSLVSSIVPDTDGRSDVPETVAKSENVPVILVKTEPDLKPITRPGRRKKK